MLTEEALHKDFPGEFVRVGDGWHLQPVSSRWRSGKNFLYAFICLFLTGVTGALSWALHRDLGIAWYWAILLVMSGTLPIGMVMTSAGEEFFRRWQVSSQRLTIPDHGEELLLSRSDNSRRSQDRRNSAKKTGSKELDEPCTKLPRRDLMAVQFSSCRMDYHDDGDITIYHMVQGILVFKGLESNELHRVPIPCTEDLTRGARLMQQLAEILRVPYLFDADRAGWRKETIRSKSRSDFTRGKLAFPSSVRDAEESIFHSEH